MTTTNRIPNGTTVTLDDGNPVTGGTRIDLGWRREQLTVTE